MLVGWLKCMVSNNIRITGSLRFCLDDLVELAELTCLSRLEEF